MSRAASHDTAKDNSSSAQPLLCTSSGKQTITEAQLW